MKQYKIKDHVTDDMLIAVGFEQCDDYYPQSFMGKNYFKSVHARLRLAIKDDKMKTSFVTYMRFKGVKIITAYTLNKRRNYGGYMHSTTSQFYPLKSEHIQDLIELGYVEEMK